MNARMNARGMFAWQVMATVIFMMAALAAFRFAGAQLPGPVYYSVTDLGPLPDATTSGAYAINNFNQTVGYSNVLTTGFRTAVVWNGATPTNLGALPYFLPNSYARGINNLGQIVGYTDSAYNRATFWNGASKIDLGTLGGDNSVAYGINDNGIIVGRADNAVNNPRAFTWQDLNANGVSDPGEMQTISGLESVRSGARAINKYNVIAGWKRTSSGYDHAFRAWGGTVTDLGTLGGSFSYGYGINESGQVVGEAQNGSGYYRAFVWTPNAYPAYTGFISNLGTLSGYSYSAAYSINKYGTAVGRVSNYSGLDFFDPNARAVIFGSGGPADLNSYIGTGTGWTLIEANGISDDRKIVGIGKRNGYYHAFRLNPLFIPL